MTNVELTVLSRRGALEFRDLTGTGLGGRLSASAVLDGTTTGATLTAKLDYTGIQLANFGGTGTADLAMTLTGSGINPAGLVSGLTGAGTLKLGPAVVREITPESLQSAIDTALKAPADKLSSVLRAALSDDAVRGTVNIGPRTIALTVQDGVARAQAVTLPLAPGRIITQATLDLATFSMSGDWRVETRMPPLPVVPALPGLPIAVPVPTPATALPVVVQRFKIVPGDLDPSRRSRRQAPESDALERELAVRKVERDLAELERLRRLDEERAVREREAAKAASEAADWARQTDVAPVVKPDAAATRQ